MSGVDPHAVLGVQPGASPDEIAAAYRRLAKEWHPDVAGAAAAVARMAEINAAYAALRDGGGGAVNGTPGGPGGVAAAGARRAPAGAWLAEDVRRALGRELLAALEPGEPVELVTPAATWASPQSVLVLPTPDGPEKRRPATFSPRTTPHSPEVRFIRRRGVTWGRHGNSRAPANP
jgi:hypothetical protein